MSLIHRAAGVTLGSSRQVADDLDHQKFEAGALRGLMPPRDKLISIKRVVGHPSIHQSIYKSAHAPDAPTSLVERSRQPHEACVHVASHGDVSCSSLLMGTDALSTNDCSVVARMASSLSVVLSST